jgi:hypothetical protein
VTHLAFIHPLLFHAGDRMSRDEFLELWEKMPDLKFAELIDGVVYLPSPVSLVHSRWDAILHGWAFNYTIRAGFIDVLPNATWLMEESAPQPDLALRIRPEYGGQSWTNEKNLAAGAPEFAAEISHSSRSYDLGPKLQLYEHAGVKEYLAILTKESEIQWRVLRAGRFHLLEAASGIYRSQVFPGLWLDEAAFWKQDILGVLATLEKGLQSPEFVAFRDSHSTPL